MHTALPDAGKTVYMAGYSAVKVQFQAVLRIYRSFHYISSASYWTKQNQIEASFRGFIRWLDLYKDSWAPHYRGPEQCEQWNTYSYLRWLEILTLVGNFALKTLSWGGYLWTEFLTEGLGTFTQNFCFWSKSPPHPVVPSNSSISFLSKVYCRISI